MFLFMLALVTYNITIIIRYIITQRYLTKKTNFRNAQHTEWNSNSLIYIRIYGRVEVKERKRERENHVSRVI